MPRALSEGALRRAETVFERLDRLEASAVPGVASGAPELVLAPWRQAVARDDAAAFARRLEWDGISPTGAVAAVGGEDDGPAPAADPVVERWLDAVAAASRRPAGPGRGRVAATELAFAELLEPWADVAEERLRDETPRWESIFAAAARSAWTASLLRRLGWIAALPLYSRLLRVRTADREAGVYARWVDAELSAGSDGYFEEFPVLARQLAWRAEDWIAATLELLGRVDEDRLELAARFAAGASTGRVAELDAGLSDPHARGRRVVAIRFESGLEVVYKPRPVALEAWFERLLRWLAEEGLDAAPPAVATLDRGRYGWQERIEAEQLEDESEVTSWYRVAGAMTAIAWLFGARDLHAENLIATRRGPVLVDAEMLLSPRLARTAAIPESFEGVLATGLVADPAAPAGPGAIGYAGLATPHVGELPEPDREWTGLGTDELRLDFVRPAARLLANAPRRGGRPQRAEAFVEPVLEGFELAARFLAARRPALTAPGGLLDLARGAPTRVLFRPSGQYGGLLALLARPRYLADGLASSFLVEALLRAFAASPERPLLWPLVAEERAAVERLDVPVFRLPVESSTLEAESGERIGGWFGMSGLDAVRSRLEALDERSIGRERESLRRALAPRRMTGREEESILLAAASAIAAALEASRDFGARARSGAGLRELALYGGAIGRALFAAGAFRATGVERWRGLAERLAGSVAEVIAAPAAPGVEDRDRSGATDGWGSLIWSFVAFAEVLGDRRWLDGARLATAALERAPADPERWGFDVAAGEAGALLGLLALAETGDEQALLLATRRGQLLVEAAQPAGGWAPPGGGPALAGFAHGAAGVARALDALSRATAEPRFAAAAAAGRRYEQALFDGTRRDWPALAAAGEPGRVERRWPASWCHGAPGVALDRALRLAAGGEPGDPTTRAELDAALGTISSLPLPEVDHVCCGSAGRWTALAAAGRWLAREDHLAAARGLARRAQARAESRGGWTIPSAGPAGERPDLGFFRGYAGLGWSLVALTPEGAALPVVAALELPSEARRRGSST